MFKNAKAFQSFSVDNLARAKEFYGGVLELEVKEIPEGLEVAIAGSNPLFVYEKSNHVPATFTILNFPVADIDTAVDNLAQKGVKFEIYNEPQMKTDAKGIARDPEGRGPTIAWFKDPAGNFLSVIEDKK